MSAWQSVCANFLRPASAQKHTHTHTPTYIHVHIPIAQKSCHSCAHIFRLMETLGCIVAANCNASWQIFRQCYAPWPDCHLIQSAKLQTMLRPPARLSFNTVGNNIQGASYCVLSAECTPMLTVDHPTAMATLRCPSPSPYDAASRSCTPPAPPRPPCPPCSPAPSAGC